MEQEMTLDLREIFEIIKKRFWIILLVTVASTVISGIVSFFIIPPTYQAKTSIIIGKTPTGSSNEQIQYNDVMMYQKLIKTYSEIAKSRTVAEATSQKLGGIISPDALISSITVTPQADTQIMTLSIQGKNPQEIANIINTHAQVFITESARLYPTGNVQIMDEATVPNGPIKPRPMMNIAIGFFLGAMVSLGIIFLIEYMDNTIKTENDVEKYLGLPVIGVIPKNTND